MTEIKRALAHATWRAIRVLLFGLGAFLIWSGLTSGR